MNEDTAELVLASIDRFNHRDFDGALAYFDPEITWEVGPDFVVDAGTYRGYDGVRTFWDHWHGAFEAFTLVIEECRAVDENRVLVMTSARGRGAGSGVEVSSAQFAQLFEVRDGRVVRVHLDARAERALSANRRPPPADNR